MWRWEERGRPGQGDTPPVSWAWKPTCWDLHELWSPHPGEGASLQAAPMPHTAQETFSSQATEQLTIRAPALHLC